MPLNKPNNAADRAAGFASKLHAGELEVGIAAQWYAANREGLRRAFIPELRRRFGLSALEAIEAGKLAYKIQLEQGGENGPRV